MNIFNNKILTVSLFILLLAIIFGSVSYYFLSNNNQDPKFIAVSGCGVKGGNWASPKIIDTTKPNTMYEGDGNIRQTANGNMILRECNSNFKNFNEKNIQGSSFVIFKGATAGGGSVQNKDYDYDFVIPDELGVCTFEKNSINSKNIQSSLAKCSKVIQKDNNLNTIKQ